MSLNKIHDSLISTAFKMSTIKNISLFIPYVFPNFTQQYITNAFKSVGDVERVDFVSKQDRNGKMYNSVYIHFKEWYDTTENRDMQFAISMYGSDRFYHDKTDYYWIVVKNTAVKQVSGDRKPKIDLGNVKTMNIRSIETEANEVVHTVTPSKPTYAQIVTEKKTVGRDLDSEFQKCLDMLNEPVEAEEWDAEEWDAEASEEAIEMAEMEADLDVEDSNLIKIDYRYIQAIEYENAFLHGEIMRLNETIMKYQNFKALTFGMMAELSREKNRVRGSRFGETERDTEAYLNQKVEESVDL